MVQRAADEAANRAISSYVQSNRQELGGINVIDRRGITVSQQEYERMIRDARDRVGGDSPGNFMSLGKRFEDALNQKFTDEVMGNLIGKMFSGGNPVGEVKKPHTGIMGALFDIADTKMGYAFGEKLGGNINELIKTIGQERVGAIIDAYSGRTNPNQQQLTEQQQTLSPEEQQRQTEYILMSLDTTNVEHMNKFMQMTGVNNLYEAQKMLLTEQDRILQKRGLSRPENLKAQVGEQSSAEGSRTRTKNRREDMNRDLIDRYDSPNQSPSVQQNDFFGSSMLPTPGASFQQTPEEIILSLNPDDPTSIHQYSSMRNLVNVDASTIKKMLMQEQRNLLSKASSPVSEGTQKGVTLPPMQDAQSVENRGITPDEDQSRLRGGSPVNEFLVEIPPGTSQNITQGTPPKIQEPPVQQSSNIPTNKESTESKESIEAMNTIMRVLDKLDKKIDSLESEITILKSSTQIKADDFTDILSSEEPITTKIIDVDTIINKAPKIVSLNEITKEFDNIEDLEGVKNDISTIISHDVENKPEGSISEEEPQKEMPETKTENDIKIDLKNDELNIGEIDWFGERRKIMDDIKNESIHSDKEKQIDEKEHKKFKIKKS